VSDAEQQDPIERLRRHRAATERPAEDLAWWLWDLADDDIGRRVRSQLADLRKTDDVGRILLRRRILSANGGETLERLAEHIQGTLGRPISRQALHSREVELRRELEPAVASADESAVGRYLDERLGRAGCIEMLEEWERVVLDAQADDTLDWPHLLDCAQLIASRLAAIRCVDRGWWFDAAPGTDLPGWVRYVTDELLGRLGGSLVTADMVLDELGRLGVSERSRPLALGLLEAHRTAVVVPDGRLVLFPADAARTLADRVRHLASVTTIDVGAAAALLVARHGENRRTLANVVRSISQARR
jgi:hypothetical protein